jgi:hypothetical protein
MRAQNRLFSKGYLSNELMNIKQTIASRVGRSSDTKLNEDMEQLCEEIHNELFIRVPVINESQIQTLGKREVESDRGQIIVVVVMVVPFSGQRDLFFLRPSQYKLSAPCADVKNTELHMSYVLGEIKEYLSQMESDVKQYNSQIRVLAKEEIQRRKDKLMKEKEQIEGIGFPIRKK